MAKDGKSYESGEIGHSEVNLSIILEEKMENMQNDQNWPF